jgi:hypothetical protein
LTVLYRLHWSDHQRRAYSALLDDWALPGIQWVWG